MPRKGEVTDLTGECFGHLKVVGRAPDKIIKSGKHLTAWECECQCGNRKIVLGSNLRTGNTRSCGRCGLVRHCTEFEDLTGRQFGFLTVVSRADNHVSSGGNSFVAWDCECECGRRMVVTSGHLKTGHTMSCGQCGKYERSVDFTGRHIGRLTVLGKSDEWYTYPNGDRDFKWICRCECGNIVVTRGNTLRNTRFKQSCGCWRREESVKDEDMLGRDFGYCHVESRADRIHVTETATVDGWYCVCLRCGTHFVARGPQLRFGNVVSCGCISVSKWELWLSQFLDENGLRYVVQKCYPDLFGVGGGLLSYDFCVSLGSCEVLVECQGRQHYEPVEYFGGNDTFLRQVEHDVRKREYAESHGIHLIELDCSVNMCRDTYFELLQREFSEYI